MATVDLMQIYTDIFAKKFSHCALCYRSDTEIRLVKSAVFKKVLQAMKYSEVFMKNEKLCYMCEAHMVSVAKFVDTLHLALEVQRVFMRAEMSSKYRKKIMAGNLEMCQKDFAKLRKKVQLHQTNVLVVDSFKYTDEALPASPVPSAQPASPAPPAEPGPQNNSNINASIPEIETVFLNDIVPMEQIQIEVDAETPIPQLNTIQIPFALANPMNKVVIGIATDNNLYMVPTLTIDGSSGLAQTILQTNSSVAPKKNVKKRTKKEINASKKKSKYTVLPTIVDCRTENNAFIEVDVLGDMGMDIVQPVPQVVKLPIRTDSAVDWEDKIPMEVISFADDNPAPKAPDKHEVGQHVANPKEVIDLC